MTMNKISAAVAAMLCLAGANAHAAGVRPGFYEGLLIYTSVDDPSGNCGSQLHITPGFTFEFQAMVGGTGKPLLLNNFGVNAQNSGIEIRSLAFSNFPATTDTGPTNYSGTATGSQADAGVTLSWNTGTINSVTVNQFKVTLSNVTVSYGGQPVCVVSLDSGLLFTGK
jgi:hypothetical protein